MWREMPCPWGHRQVRVLCVTELAGAVFILLTPGWEHREDPCLEGIFLGAISQIQDKDVTGDIGTNLYHRTVPNYTRMLGHPTSVETPVIRRILERGDISTSSSRSRTALFLVLLSFPPSHIPQHFF